METNQIELEKLSKQKLILKGLSILGIFVKTLSAVTINFPKINSF